MSEQKFQTAMSEELDFTGDYVEDWEVEQRLLSLAKSGDTSAAHRLAEKAIEIDEPYLKSLIEQLKPGLTEGKWNTILGDDRDGRIPALIVGRIAAKIATSKGVKPPKRLFFAGGRDLLELDEEVEGEDAFYHGDRYYGVQDHLYANVEPPVLLVTQYVETGDTANHIANMLSWEYDELKKNIEASKGTSYEFQVPYEFKETLPLDIATVTAGDGLGQVKELLHANNWHGLNPNLSIYVGGELDYESHSAFTGATHFTGLKEGRHTGDVTKVGAFALPERDPAYRTLINAARDVAYDFADKVYDEMFNQHSVGKIA